MNGNKLDNTINGYLKSNNGSLLKNHECEEVVIHLCHL